MTKTDERRDAYVYIYIYVCKNGCVCTGHMRIHLFIFIFGLLGALPSIFYTVLTPSAVSPVNEVAEKVLSSHEMV